MSTAERVRLHLVPVSKAVARAFIQEHHRHNEAPSSAQVALCVGLADEDGNLVAVATAGWPVNQNNADGFTLEVNRSCSIVEDVTVNANSRLYGALARAAQALGYRRLITYTLQSESGTSLRASGFRVVATLDGRSSFGSGTGTQSRYRPPDVTLWGERRQAQNEPKLRWQRDLAA